jgi:hypothetical protein
MPSNKERKNIDDPIDRNQGQSPEQRKRIDDEEDYNTGNTPRSGEKLRDEAARAGQGRGGTNK